MGKRAAERISAEMARHVGVPDGRAPGLLGRGLPGNNVTCGKRRSGTTNKGNRWLGEISNQRAWARPAARQRALTQLEALGYRVTLQPAASCPRPPADVPRKP